MTTSTDIRVVTLALVAVIAGGSACGSTDARPSGDASRGDVCESADECPGEQTCRAGYCTHATASLDEVRFEFIPPDDSGYNPQSAALSVRAGQPLDFALEQSVDVQGQLTYAGRRDSSVDSPSGPLTFRRRGRDDTLFDIQTRSDRQGAFETRVLPGRYDLVFAPDEYPSYIWRDISLRADTDLGELSVPVERELATIRGRVVFRRPGPGEEPRMEPVEGADVLAVSQDGGFTTTFDTTGREGEGEAGPGQFSLRAIPNTGPYDLIVDPGRDRMLPKARFEEVFEAGDGLQQLDEPLDLGTWGTATSLEVDTVVPLAQALPEPAADTSIDWTRVRAVARANLEEGREFRREATPDEQGRLNLELLPAQYEISLYPPSDAPIASTTLRVDLSGSELPRLSDWSWRPKHTLEGQIMDHHGEPVAGARVTFRPDGLADEKFRDRLKVTVRTNADGRFAVQLDRFDHEMLIRPPADSGLPRSREMLTYERLREDKSVQVRLAEPLLLEGSVLGAAADDAAPIPGTSVNAYLKQDGEQVTLGKATTGPRGSFRMVVPASAP